MSTICEKITRDMTIQDVFSKFPSKAQKLAQELTRTGLNCVGCSASTWETVESGMLRHGYGEEDIEQLLIKLNAIVEKTCQPEDAPAGDKNSEYGITLTDAAAEQFKHISKLEGKESWALRFDEEPAGCSGFQYVLGFSQKPEHEDKIFHSNGVEIHVNILALNRLDGCEIDYQEGLQSGFTITNPNAASSCGCGNSHGYK